MRAINKMSRISKTSKVKKLLIFMVLSVSMLNLTGCMAAYGNFTSASTSINQQMANDTANQMAMLYPPAQTRLNIHQSISDPYGNSLIQYLRLKGYAIDVVGQNNTRNNRTSGLEFRYVLDVPPGANFYRVTVFVGQQSLSQVYRPAQNGKVYAAGSWVRKE